MAEGVTKVPISPSDIVVAITYDGETVIIGTATGISVTVDRRKIPIYALGYVDPIGIGRGTRLITGIIDFIAIKTSAVKILYDKFGNTAKVILTNQEANSTNRTTGATSKKIDNISDAYYEAPIKHLDELPPVDIYVLGVSEAADPDSNKHSAAMMKLEGVEFVSADWAISSDDVAAAERVSFIAKHFEPWHSITLTTTNNG